MQHKISLLMALQARATELLRVLDELVERGEQEAADLAKQSNPDIVLDSDHYRNLKVAKRIMEDREAQVALQLEYLQKLWKAYTERKR
jgi:hypothetical protein